MQHRPDDEIPGEWKTWLWMAACCIPMIAIFVLIALRYW